MTFKWVIKKWLNLIFKVNFQRQKFRLKKEKKKKIENISFKGQLHNFNFDKTLWFLQIYQKTNTIFVRISTLAYKKMSNQKIRALYTTN